ncbi:zinc finger MYM-type protein 1-like [Photinus pyralis]|uniref:zinc finger MYM-type protein 1-like n=1 Tax=Photinus pyralis TaxID=7054 RepID=UPI00126777AC|nr:zinc finger MYM-type protein 1-like [Photinus pyralis]
MDIRKFLISEQNSNNVKDDGIAIASSSGIGSELPTEVSKKSNNSSKSGLEMVSPQDVSNIEVDIFHHKFDLGNFVNPQKPISDSIKFDLIKSPFKPSINYNFKGDSREGKSKRAFRYEWFQQFEWLAYSSKLKGALCKNCVIFRPAVNRGVQGAFIVRPFIKYNDFIASAKAHSTSDWHKQSTVRAENFIKSIEGKTLPVIDQISNAERELTELNRKKLYPIISTIIFCGTHDLPLRGTTKGNFEDLLDFRVESGDQLLNEHLTSCNKNAKYTSHQTQNELISICGSIIRKEIVEEVNASDGFSIIADESADIAGKEQLSLGVRFVDKANNIREEFLGFSELTTLNANGISNTILNFCLEHNLNMDKLVGLGFDGCSTMAGHENGVQKRIRDKYPKATFFHCASHKLNLVINDLNRIQDIQNTAATIKEIINFFRDSPLRRKYIPNLPLFSETRWSAKYKSIRVFAANFVEITNALDTLAFSSDVNIQTRTKANQLLTSVSSWSSRTLAFTKAASVLKLMIPSANVVITWRSTTELNPERTLHSNNRFRLCKL